MNISFDNLGAIRKANLDLSKKLTVFCGPNGTGKTYACYAIYGYLEPLWEGFPLFTLDNLLQKKSITVKLNYQELYKWRTKYFSFLTERIKYVFGVNSADYFNSFKSGDLLTKDQYTALLRKREFEFNFTYDNISITYKKVNDDNVLHISINDSVPLDKITERAEIYHLAIITKYLCNRGLLYAYMLPVERNSAYTFGNELAAGRLDTTTSKDKKPLPTKKEQNYPSPIKNILSIAVKLKDIKDINSNSTYHLLASEIENNILHGKIEISDEGALRFISEKTQEVVLPVHLSASIIKNISGLLIYLRYQAKNNELLIIDEPEMGLHPDNQILLARIFARLINNGLRLLISTHSDYIIRELNNLIILSSDKDEVRAKAIEFNYHPEEKIDPEDVKAYLFDYNTEESKRVDVQELLVDKNGFEVETIDKTISTLNDRSMELFFSLQQTMEEDKND
ncbi:hypothetical protein EZS27_027937 [termite gut metagenome]|uniref:Endonuclease GajA/Old nuclease/RecF-like AAA domain-containing protein n=1 Tax=termite gut metagenome TaxID=433724 RepID=A0A5J4QLW1_9ZZZZ